MEVQMKQYVPRAVPARRPGPPTCQGLPSSRWIPPAQRDTAWWIFFCLFRCRLERILTIPIDEMQEVGTPTSFDPDVDRQMQNERVERMLPIARMAEYWDQGISIGLVNPKDAKAIYEHLSNHLYAWKDKLENELCTRNAPLEDLAKLDAFANVVYAQARYQFPSDYQDSRFTRKARGLFSLSGASLVRPLEPEVTTIHALDEESDPRVQRAGLAEVFVRARPFVDPAGRVPRWNQR
jgi:hypothetical protein